MDDLSKNTANGFTQADRDAIKRILEKTTLLENETTELQKIMNKEK